MVPMILYPPVSKLQAAERLLSTAIRLHFEKRDPLAIHALVAPAHQILADLGRHKGFAGYLRNKIVIREVKWPEWRRVIAEAENFLKHADKDPDATLRFDPGISKLYILDSIQIHAFLAGGMFYAAKIFYLWIQLEYPELVEDEATNASIRETCTQHGLSGSDLSIFAALLNEQVAEWVQGIRMPGS